MNIKYITLEDWEREWKTKFEAVYNGIGSDNYTTSDDFVMRSVSGITPTLFKNSDWELAALPDKYWTDLTRGPEHYEGYYSPGEEYVPFIWRDELVHVFEAFAKLGLREMVLTEAHCTPIEYLNPDKIAFLIPATRAGYDELWKEYKPVVNTAFDPTGRWGMESMHECDTILGGDAEFMHTFYECSGGKQAVIDREYTYYASDEPDGCLECAIDILFGYLGWDAPTVPPKTRIA